MGNPVYPLHALIHFSIIFIFSLGIIRNTTPKRIAKRIQIPIANNAVVIFIRFSIWVFIFILGQSCFLFPIQERTTACYPSKTNIVAFPLNKRDKKNSPLLTKWLFWRSGPFWIVDQRTEPWTERRNISPIRELKLAKPKNFWFSEISRIIALERGW